VVYSAVTAFADCLSSKILVTAILKGGCNLNCPFCIVSARGERQEHSYVTAGHLIGLKAAIRKRGLLGGVAIVGDEPLQDHCWPFAKAFLRRDEEYTIPTALITNGYNLVDFVEQLRQLKTTKIILSLDAASDKHDAIRRKPGAFARISEGIRLATCYPELRERLSLAAILMPGNLEDISGIIDFAAEHRIPQLLLSPLLTSARSEPLAVHPKVMREAWRDVPALLDRANAAGVRLRLSDEFAVLGPWEDKLASTGVEIVSPKEPARLIRVDAAGRIETLATMHAGTTTGLQLPADMAEIDSFAEQLISNCFEPVSLAA
jgi:sulfatase maturation enzyme AslB (radical SAM superfamily)